jgi:hypothetical protein
LTPGGLWDSNKFELWGQWLLGDKVTEKFNFSYAGKPSLFERKIIPPSDFDEVKLQILAADQSGNFGEHTFIYHMTP